MAAVKLCRRSLRLLSLRPRLHVSTALTTRPAEHASGFSCAGRRLCQTHGVLADRHVEAEQNDADFPKAAMVAFDAERVQVTRTLDESMFDTLDTATGYSALDEISEEEAAGLPVPVYLPPSSTSLRAYVDHSETLTKLVQLGVNLWKLEKRPTVGSMLLRLDFQADVLPRLLFLKQIGVDESKFGGIITTNPFFFTEDLRNLEARVHYLRSSKFGSDAVAQMVTRAPYLLNFSVKRLDNRLAFYQQQLSLSAAHTRDILSRLPRLLCGGLEPVKETLKVCEMELGFKKNEIQHIVLAVPKVLTANKRKLTDTFDLLHNTMKIPHRVIAKCPQVFNTGLLRLKERHLFLQYLGRAHYDPADPKYVSLERLVSLPNQEFCSDLAAATAEDFTAFLKTL